MKLEVAELSDSKVSYLNIEQGRAYVKGVIQCISVQNLINMLFDAKQGKNVLYRRDGKVVCDNLIALSVI